ncbi:MAG TPA: hypothetical protein VMV69_06850 [Pirellulales bacterium]|nr:hypothetical protein [Pirellulales bacterium]
MSTASLAPPFDPVELYDQFGQTPFQLVRVHVADGRTYLIASREFVVVGMTYLKIGTQAIGEAEGICSEIARVPFDMIEKIEAVGVPKPPISI